MNAIARVGAGISFAPRWHGKWCAIRSVQCYTECSNALYGVRRLPPKYDPARTACYATPALPPNSDVTADEAANSPFGKAGTARVVGDHCPMCYIFKIGIFTKMM